MQPYPRAPDLVWPGHLHGSGCLSARAVGTGFPTVGLRLWLGPGCSWVWVVFTPARLGSWAGVLGPGLGCAPPFLAGLSGCVFCVFFFLLLAFLVPGLVFSPPIPFLSGSAAGFFFFFFVVCVCLFRCPFSRWAAVPGLLLAVLAGWSPCDSLGVLSLVPSGLGVCPLLCCGRAVWWLWAVLPHPPSPPPPSFFFFFLGGGGLAVPPFASLRLALTLWLVGGVVGPSPLLAVVPVCYSPPLLAGFRCRCWWAVPASPGWGPLAAVVCGGGVLVGLWLVCGVVGPSPLLAVVPVCYSPPLLAGFRCRWWWAVPATPGWGPLAALVCGVRCVAVGCWWGCGWCVVWLVPRHSWLKRAHISRWHYGECEPLKQYSNHFFSIV